MSASHARSIHTPSGSRILIRITIGLLIVFAIASAVAIYFDQESQMQRILERRAALSGKLEEAKTRLAELRELQVIADTDEYIERVARDKLGMIKPNEIIFED